MNSSRRRFLKTAGVAGLGWAGLSNSVFGQDPCAACLGSTSNPPPTETGHGGRGLALTIGLNFIDATHYGDNGQLSGCENDAKDVAELAGRAGFAIQDVLLSRSATKGAVRQRILEAKNQLGKNDIYLIQYSGHGGRVTDDNGDEGLNGKDSTWCLYDGQLIDDELYELWKAFRPGVRILVLSDSCHSGTVTKVLRYRELIRDGRFDDTLAERGEPVLGPSASATPRAERNIRSVPGMRAVRAADTQEAPYMFRFLPESLTDSVYQSNPDVYDRRINRNRPIIRASDLDASVLLISGCQDSEYSQDGRRNGLFTEHLVRAWGNGTFQGDYTRFHAQIVNNMRGRNQTPNLYPLGPTSFVGQKPFAI